MFSSASEDHTNSFPPLHSIQFPHHHRFPRRQRILAWLLLFILGGGVYINALSSTFIWDDHNFVAKNIHLRDVGHIPRIFQTPIAGGSPVDYHYYRPVQELSYLVDYSLWKLDARGYHFTSVLLHIVVAGALMQFIFLLSGNVYLSVLSALLFVVHPVHTEAVTYISGRGDLLAALFMVSFLCFYIQNDVQGATRNIGLLFLLSLAALFTKENSLMLLPILFGFHFMFKRPVRFQQILPLVLSIMIYFGVKGFFVHGVADMAQQIQEGWGRLPGFFHALGTYVRILCLPFGLHFDYGQILFTFKNPRVIAGIVASLSLCFVALKQRARYPLFSFGVFWFFIHLLPYSNIYLLHGYMAEHNLYLPSVSFFILCSWGILQSYTRFSKTWMKICCLGLIFFWGSITIYQNFIWSHPLFFYQRILDYNPRSSGAYHNLGVEYGRQGNVAKEVAYYQQAIALEPGNALYLKNLAFALIEQRKWQEASVYLKKAIQQNAEIASAYMGLGIIMDREGRVDEAQTYFEQAVRLNPDYYPGWQNLGLYSYKMKTFTKSLHAAQRMVDLDQTHRAGYYLLGKSYVSLGQNQQALEVFQDVSQMNPGDKTALFFKALILIKDGRPSEAQHILAEGFLQKSEYDQALRDIDIWMER